MYAGRNQKGDEYQIYEVEAAKPDGSLVNEKLRAFTALPSGQEVDVTVVPFDSEKHGRSYTLHLKGARSAGSTGQLNELREEVSAQREMIAKLVERLNRVESALDGLLRNGDRPARQASPEVAALDAEFGKEAPW